MNTRRWAVNAVRILTVAILIIGSYPLAFAQETHPGGSWGAWLTLPQYPKLHMRVKCEYWDNDPSDNKRAHSLWAIQYRSDYARPMDVVQANSYYSMVLKTNKNWDAPGQFTIQPLQTVDYGETTVLGACPKAGGASPINLAVYCVVPSGQADQSASCQAHGAPKVQQPGSATASGSSSTAAPSETQSASETQSTSETQSKQEVYWTCFGGDRGVVTGTMFGRPPNYDTLVADTREFTRQFYAWYYSEHPAAARGFDNDCKLWFKREDAEMTVKPNPPYKLRVDWSPK